MKSKINYLEYNIQDDLIIIKWLEINILILVITNKNKLNQIEFLIRIKNIYISNKIVLKMRKKKKKKKKRIDKMYMKNNQIKNKLNYKIQYDGKYIQTKKKNRKKKC